MPRAPRDGSRSRSPATREWLYGIHPVREALRARRRALHRLWLRKGLRAEAAAALAGAARQAGLPVEEVDAETLAAAVPAPSCQGVALEVGPLPELTLAELAGGEAPRTLVALDGVEDPQNLGAIARVAETAGVRGLLLTQRRAAPASPAAVRASAGALEWLPVARVPNLGRALNQLKSEGFWIFGGDPEGEHELYALPDRLLSGDRVLVLGAEGRGLRPGIRKHLDHCVEIAMSGHVESLNVSAAAAVLLFEFRRRERLAKSS